MQTAMTPTSPVRRTVRLGTFNLNLVAEPVGEEMTLDQRLGHQFIYFKEQFLDAAASLGIAVPLDIVEDKSGHIYPFLQASGPKYIFQIMHGNMHNVHLMRCALSLLIITTSLLRKRIQTMESEDARHHIHRPNLEKEWAKVALNKFSDSVTMGSCVTILISTYNPVVQELTLNLMATLIAVSDDAIRQMLLAPNSRFSSASNDTSHHKVLSLHLRRLNSRVNTAETSPSESRRQSVSAGGMVLPTSVIAANGSMDIRKSFVQRGRASFQRQSRSNDFGFNEAEVPGAQEEYNSCLAHILSVVLMQKNRHLLLGACTDVIQAMAKQGSSELCEIIARTPTCSLPMIDLDRHLAAKKKQQKATPINPLGSKIIEWAGLKIPLKFLQRYHALYSVQPSKDEESDLSFRASTSQIKEEYAYAHHSAFLAVCYLITGSQAVAEQVLDLPGAADLLQLSLHVYTVSHNMEPEAAILNALNTLQLEKVHRAKVKEREQTSHGEGSSSSAPSPTMTGIGGGGEMSPSRLAAPGAARSPTSLPTMRTTGASRGSSSRAAGPRTTSSSSHPRPGSTKKAPSSSSNTSKAPKDFPWATAMVQASPAKLTSHSQPVELASQHAVDFGTSYSQETEQNRLYLFRQADSITRERGEASAFVQEAAGELRGQLQAPLHEQPPRDALLEHSLQAIDANIAESILQPREDDRQPAYAQRLGLVASAPSLTEGLPTVSFGTYYNASTSSGSPLRRRPGTGQSELQHGLSATKDFFGKIPAEPFIPKRIEPKDCIHPTEDLDKIRQKFKMIAQNAVAKIKHQGVIRNGRNSVSIEERARRVYSPKKLPSLARSSSQPLSLSTTATATATELPPIATPLQVAVDGPGMVPPALHATRGDSHPFERSGPLGESAEDYPTPAWNSISSSDAGYFGFKFDNTDMEEPALFDNFKPIFDYPTKPETVQQKPTTVAAGTRPFGGAGRLAEVADLAPPTPAMEAADDPLLN